MARQGNLQFVGTEDNVIYYERFGKYYMRKKPEEVKQTEATIRRAGDFGMASRIAKQCRVLFGGLISNPKDKAMQNDLNSLIYRWILGDNSETLPEFHFRRDQKLQAPLRWKPSVELKEDQSILLKLPAFDPYKSFKGTDPNGVLLTRIGIAWIAQDPALGILETIERELKFNDKGQEEEFILLKIPEIDPKYMVIALHIERPDDAEKPFVSAITTGLKLCFET